ncbi:MAG: hypothetical protein LBT54_04015 [Bifidobacteriaceae bacterium]|nr:hypothetical protein [Bifidobacteriaceae bacterium]
MNFDVCRSVYRTHNKWIITGVRPELGPPPEPAHPVEPSYSAGEWEPENLLEPAMESGDPQGLRDYLTSNGSCGQWIPLTPNDSGGPTIADAIEGKR